MKKQKIDTSGTEMAQRAIAEAQERANNLQRNFAADLKTENLTNVDTGGSAEELDVLDDTKKRRRAPAKGGLSSQLGISA
jgi:hypothetical protein